MFWVVVVLAVFVFFFVVQDPLVVTVFATILVGVDFDTVSFPAAHSVTVFDFIVAVSMVVEQALLVILAVI